MKLQTITENVKSTSRILRNDLNDRVQARRSPLPITLSA